MVDDFLDTTFNIFPCPGRSPDHTTCFIRIMYLHTVCESCGIRYCKAWHNCGFIQQITFESQIDPAVFLQNSYDDKIISIIQIFALKPCAQFNLSVICIT